MPAPTPPQMAALRGGTGPRETATSVMLGSAVDRTQANLAALLAHIDALRSYVEGLLADEAASRSAADAAEAAARSAGDAALQAQVDLKAPSASPTLTGTVTVPTPPAASNGTVAASTAYVTSAVAAEASARSSADTNLQNQVNAKAPLNSPVLTGNPQAPKRAWGDNSNSIATTSWVTDVDAWLQQQIDGKANASHGHGIGDVGGLQGALDGKAEWWKTDDLQSQINSLNTRVTNAGW